MKNTNMTMEDELNITSNPVKEQEQTMPLMDILSDSIDDPTPCKPDSDTGNSISSKHSFQGSKFKTKHKVIILIYNLAYKHKSLYNIIFIINIFLY